MTASCAVKSTFALAGMLMIPVDCAPAVAKLWYSRAAAPLYPTFLAAGGVDAKSLYASPPHLSEGFLISYLSVRMPGSSTIVL